MLNTIQQYLTKIGSGSDREVQSQLFKYATHTLRNCAANSAGLVIHGAGSTLAKTGSTDFYAVVNGRLVKIPASTDMPALTGININAGNFNVVAFFVDGSGTVTAVGGTQAASVGAVVFPDFQTGKALVGFLIITYASAFIGGTTPLDTATTVYVSPIGAFDPTILFT